MVICLNLVGTFLFWVQIMEKCYNTEWKPGYQNYDAFFYFLLVNKQLSFDDFLILA